MSKLKFKAKEVTYSKAGDCLFCKEKAEVLRAEPYTRTMFTWVDEDVVFYDRIFSRDYKHYKNSNEKDAKPEYGYLIKDREQAQSVSVLKHKENYDFHPSICRECTKSLAKIWEDICPLKLKNTDE